MAGINATRDVLKDQLVLAADTIIEQAAELEIYKILYRESIRWSPPADTAPMSRLARWVRRAWA